MFLKIAQPFMAGNDVIQITKSRQGRQTISFVPDGTGSVCWTPYPALKRWAIFVKLPSMPMSPTCVLLGMLPRATTARFSNSKGGIAGEFSSVRRVVSRSASVGGSLRGARSEDRPLMGCVVRPAEPVASRAFQAMPAQPSAR